MRISHKLLQEKDYLFFNLFNTSAKVKVRAFIRILARDYGHEIEGVPGMKSIPFPISVEEIAAITSTPALIVEEILFDLEEDGLLSFADEDILILDQNNKMSFQF